MGAKSGAQEPKLLSGEPSNKISIYSAPQKTFGDYQTKASSACFITFSRPVM